jgi:hypothetical protein
MIAACLIQDQPGLDALLARQKGLPSVGSPERWRVGCAHQQDEVTAAQDSLGQGPIPGWQVNDQEFRQPRDPEHQLPDLWVRLAVQKHLWRREQTQTRAGGEQHLPQMGSPKLLGDGQ